MLRVEQVQVELGGKPVLQNVTLNVMRGELVCLLGASGCGKTTLLRVVAGLQTIERGRVLLDGVEITHKPVHERGFGLMFQDFALFPHLNVGENVAFGLRMQGLARAERAQRVADVLQWVGLADFARRDMARLSGGERQRVALARSLAPNPPLLMLDEPLGALDAALRERLIGDMRAILKRVGITALYVTHDQAEAYALADRVALMHDGQIEQIDTPQMIYRQPQTAYAAQFLGLHNLLPVLEWRDGSVLTAAGLFRVAGAPPRVLLHPDGLSLDTAGAEQVLEGQLTALLFKGQQYQVTVSVNATLLIFNVPFMAGGHLTIGQPLRIGLRADAVIGLQD